MDELEKLRQLTQTITSNGYLSDQTKAWKYAFDSVKELVCITNPKFEIKFINKPLSEKLNIDPNDGINKTLNDIFEQGLFSATTAKEHQLVIANEYTSYGEMYIESLGGWYERHRYLIESASGKLIGYTFMLIDVTERKQTELELEENRQLLEGVLDAIPDVISVQDTSQTIIKCNRAALDFFNLTSEDIGKKKCYELLGRDGPCEHCQTKFCKQSKCPEKLEKYIEELGSWFDCRSYPILDEQGKVVKVIEHLRDISEAKNEQALIEMYQNRMKQAFQRLHFIISAVNGYIWEKQKLDNLNELTHTFVDPTFCRDFYGFETEVEDNFDICKRAYNRTGTELLDEFRADGRKHTFGDLCISTDKHCEEQGKPCEYFEMGYIEHEKGKPEWFILRVRKTPIYNEHGECTGVIGFANDCSNDVHSIKLLIESGIRAGRIKKLDVGDTESRVYWVLERKKEEKGLGHLDFP